MSVDEIESQKGNLVSRYEEAVTVNSIEDLLKLSCDDHIVVGDIMPDAGYFSLTKRRTLQKNDNNGLSFIAINRLEGKIYSAVCWYLAGSNLFFSGWKQLAAAESPVEYDLIITDSQLTAYDGGNWKNCYSKDQFGYVHIDVNMQTHDGLNTINGLRNIASIPKGFRPRQAVKTSVVARSFYSADNYEGEISVDSGGALNVGVYGYTGLISGQISFLASQ